MQVFSQALKKIYKEKPQETPNIKPCGFVYSEQISQLEREVMRFQSKLEGLVSTSNVKLDGIINKAMSAAGFDIYSMKMKKLRGEFAHIGVEYESLSQHYTDLEIETSNSYGESFQKANASRLLALEKKSHQEKLVNQKQALLHRREVLLTNSIDRKTSTEISTLNQEMKRIEIDLRGLSREINVHNGHAIAYSKNTAFHDMEIDAVQAIQEIISNDYINYQILAPMLNDPIVNASHLLKTLKMLRSSGSLSEKIEKINKNTESVTKNLRNVIASIPSRSTPDYNCGTDLKTDLIAYNLDLDAKAQQALDSLMGQPVEKVFNFPQKVD